MADDSKYAVGGKLAFGTKEYTLKADGDEWELESVEDGAFGGRVLDDSEISELIDQLGATYEAPEAEAAAE